ncbi:hypothetical protein PHISCL_08514 [Aspergillus sclerotialis]|uniref:Uncharacterized protein n=1 Tax=Aspergillus sclerotialis TaxID=2070753 RepID=A0A3A2ZPZ5_9EURO|nr:hypothetical protein PHISCL_08514 [Aspergillus sclerotialis]
MTAKISSKGLNIEWDLDDKEATRRYFLNFPHDKVPLRVKIDAPKTKDPGQIVLLWHKVTALVERSMSLSESKGWRRKLRLYVKLVGRWEREGSQNEVFPALDVVMTISLS